METTSPTRTPAAPAEALARRLEGRHDPPVGTAPSRALEIEALARLAATVRRELTPPPPRPDFVRDLRRRLPGVTGRPTDRTSLTAGPA